jgi:tRNA(Ile)-lysidine synthase
VAVRRRIVRALWRAASRRAPLEMHHVEAVLALARRRAPGRVTLPGGFEAFCRYGVLSVRRAPGPVTPLEPVLVPVPGRYALPELGAEVEVTVRDPSVVPWPLALRSRLPGDRFRPQGRAGEQKLKRWLIDRKVPREVRDRLVVLADAGGRVLAIPELSAVAQGTGGLAVSLAAAR